MDDTSEIKQAEQTNANEADTSREVAAAITVKDFLSQKEALRFAVNSDAGTVAWLGTVIGTVFGGVEKKTTRPDGTVLRSYQFNGAFEMQRYSDGIVKTSKSVYLPGAFASELELVYQKMSEMGNSSVSFAVEIGIEALDRTIPYAWRVKAYGKRQVDLLASVRGMLPQGLKHRVQLAMEADRQNAIEGTAERLPEPDPTNLTEGPAMETVSVPAPEKTSTKKR
jgi:hypothetical protein